MTEGPLPPLRRDVEVVPFEEKGQPLFLVRDPEGSGDHALALSPAGMAVASLLDGSKTLAAVQGLLKKATGGVEIPLEQLKKVVDELARLQLLETPEVQAQRRKVLEAFRASPVRPAAHLDGYPKGGLELASFLGAFFRDKRGPGKPMADKPAGKKPLRGLLAPHIDLHRGGPAYAWAYGALADAPPPDLILSLGVAHSSPNSPWVLTKKRYQTPYGDMAVSDELYQDVAGALWYDPLDDEWVHRKEHSLEFQALWLRFLWRDATPPWLPVLCSSFDRFAPDRAPSSIATVEEALVGIGARLRARARKRRILILGGVDLAHVGPRFGDDIQLSNEVENRIEREDRASLEKALALDADGFYKSVIADGHWRKVCGLSAIYTALRLLGALGVKGDGTLLTYGQAPDPMGGIVSFAGVEFKG